MTDTNIDPVAGLVAYVEEIKPYHTKIIEVLVEYIHTDCIDVTFTEELDIALGVPADPSKWGWTEAEAARLFNDNWSNYQISGASSSGKYWEVSGDYATDFVAGDKILVKDDNIFTEYTVALVSVSSETINGNVVKTTRIGVDEPPPAYIDNVIGSPPVQVPIAGAIFHSSAYSYDVNSGTYSLNAGLVFPSAIGVDRIGPCGGYGSRFEYLLESAAVVPNNILLSESTLNYFEISNTFTAPITGANTWADILKYGVKVSVNGTVNDGIYTVFLSIPNGGSPDILRVYVLESVGVSEGVGGTLTVQTWGYDEPDVCVNQGQSGEAAAHISEHLQFVVNDVDNNFVGGFDMNNFDIGNYDGGPITIIASVT